MSLCNVSPCYEVSFHFASGVSLVLIFITAKLFQNSVSIVSAVTRVAEGERQMDVRHYGITIILLQEQT